MKENEDYTTDTVHNNEYNEIILKELNNILKRAKNRKEPGSDEINMDLIKYGSQKFKKVMVQVLNDIWNTGCIPNEWKMAEIVNIHKKS